MNLRLSVSQPTSMYQGKWLTIKNRAMENRISPTKFIASLSKMRQRSKILLIHFSFFVICISKIYSQQIFKPVPDSLATLYKYDLEKNFFKSEAEFRKYLNNFNNRIVSYKRNLNKQATVQNLEELIQELSQLEYDFRKMDLYLFLQYATNTTNQSALVLEDSIYDVMLTQRSMYRNYIRAVPHKTLNSVLALPTMKPYAYYVNGIINNRIHELSPSETDLLKSFNYLKNNRYYDNLINSIATDIIYSATDTFDLFNDMKAWQNHPDESVRAEGEQKLYKAYSTVASPLGYQYIQMIKGLNAFSVAKKYKNLIQENCDKLSLYDTTLQTIFRGIEANSSFAKKHSRQHKNDLKRYSITETTEILLNSFQELGNDYYSQARQLLNPRNGRLDIVGGKNRMGMQGVASVYPIDVSIFYANSYEGYFIDLMLISHEAGHAVQASLMNENKVSLLNGSGPGYFTESFGKFNELLVSYYLYENAKDSIEQNFYLSKYIERLFVLFGSAEEAAIEYNLLQGIIKENITKPSDLDSITFLIGSKYRDYTKTPEQKVFWMRLETNFKAPMHNINDMVASLLAIRYFQQFLNDKKSFSAKYNRFLKNGYTDSPSNLLRDFMEININDVNFCPDVIEFIKSELLKLNK